PDLPAYSVDICLYFIPYVLVDYVLKVSYAECLHDLQVLRKSFTKHFFDQLECKTKVNGKKDDINI
ncbi:MAG: hypothetical protein WBL02_09960, partial [Methanomethylovorans sp.]|uniref:hypothetical protein n=1 Tax=Methanomethylovorans sp. TaxID=2758717 RepID=UPI003C7114F2